MALGTLGGKPRPYYKQVALHVPSELEHDFPYCILRVGREQYTSTYPIFRGRVMDVHHLIYVERGRGWLETSRDTCGAYRIGLAAGSVVALLQGTVNDMGPHADDPMEITWLVLEGVGFPQLAASVGLGPATPHALIGEAPEPRAIFRELRHPQAGHIWRVHSLLWALLARAASATGSRDMGAPPPFANEPLLFADQPGRPVAPPPVPAGVDALACDDAAVVRALDLVRLHFREPSLRLSHLAAAAGLGRSRFIERFRQATGSSPRRHLELVRMEEARRLLEEDVPVGRAAELSGFEDPLYFSRRFRALHGVAPTVYRTITRGAALAA